MTEAEIKRIEEEMAEWLSSPMEFGVRPSSLEFIKTYNCKLAGYGPALWATTQRAKKTQTDSEGTSR